MSRSRKNKSKASAASDNCGTSIPAVPRTEEEKDAQNGKEEAP